MKQFPLPVQADQFSPGSKSRVQGHDALLAYRRSQQEFPQVIRKDPDSFLVGTFLEGTSQFILKRWH